MDIDRRGGQATSVAPPGPVPDETSGDADGLYRPFLDSMAHGAAIVNSDGTILYANERLAAMLALPRQELIGLPAARLVASGSSAALDVMRTDPGVGAVELVLQRAGGPEVTVSVTASSLDLGEEVVCFMVISDISPRVRSEASLAFQSQLLDAVGEMVLATDVHGRITYANQAAEQQIGWAPGDLIGRAISEVTVAPGSSDEAAEIMARLRRGESWSGWFDIRRRDGSTFPALVTDTPIVGPDGTVTGMIGVSRDISEQVAAESRITDSERWFRTLVSNSSDLIVVVDATSRPRYANPASETILGFPMDEQLGKDPARFVHPDDQALVADQFASALDGEGTTRPVTFRYGRPDGRWLVLEAVATNCVDDPAIAGVVINARDVTERDGLRRDLQERVKELTCLLTVKRAAQQVEHAQDLAIAVAEALVVAMSDPRNACSAVELDGRAHVCGELGRDAPRLTADVVVGERVRGTVAVGYPETVDCRFLPEEQTLLDGIALTLSWWLERHETQVALAESEARFRRIFDHAPDTIYRYSVRPERRLEYVSPSVERLTGYTPEEIMAGVPTGLVHDDDAHVFDALLAGDHASPTTGMVRIHRRSGQLRHTEHHMMPVLDTNGDVVAVDGIARDVTERVTGEQEQAGIARLGEAALSSEDIAVLMSRAASAIAEALDVEAVAVIEFRDGGEAVLLGGVGWSDGVVGSTVPSVGPDALVGAAASAGGPLLVEDLAAHGSDADWFTRHGAASAAVVEIGAKDQPFGILGAFGRQPRPWPPHTAQFLRSAAHVLTQAIEGMRAQEALVRREAEFRRLAEHSPDMVVRIGRDGRVRYASPQVAAFAGVPLSALEDGTVWESGVPGVLPLREPVRTAFDTGEEATVEFDVAHPDGERHLQSWLVPEKGADGAVETVLVVTHDLTVRRRAEQQRLEMMNRIVTAQEEERKRIGEDIHDDSIQIMVATGFRLETLKRQIDDAQINATLEDLEASVRDAIVRLRNLMFALRPPELDREGLGAAVRLYLQTTEHGGGPHWTFADECVEPVPMELRIVLYRIAQEAIVNARKHAEADNLAVSVRDERGGVLLEVRDDGRGFAARELDDVGPHHLGTAAMAERAEAAGGRLEFTSTPGHGTTVAAWLPRTQPPAARTTDGW